MTTCGRESLSAVGEMENRLYVRFRLDYILHDGQLASGSSVDHLLLDRLVDLG